MAQRRASKRKSTRRKKQSDLTLNVIGLVFVVASVLALFHLGFLGMMFANLFRVFVGDTYLILVILFGLLGFYLLIEGDAPELNWQRAGGFALAYFGLLILIDAIHFNSLNIHANFVAITWRTLLADFQRANVASSVGGGLIGALGYSFSYFLLAPLGTDLLALAIMISGGLVFANVPFATVIAFLNRCAQGIRHFFRMLVAFFKAVAAWSTVQVKRFWAALQADDDDEDPFEEQLRAQSEAAQAAKQAAQEASEAPSETTSAAPADSDAFEIHHTQAETTAPTNPPQQANIPDPIEATEEPPTKTVPPVNPNYKLPSVDLLTAVPPVDQSDEYQAIDKNRKILKQTFDSFGVDVKVKSASLGPTVTRYEIQPAVGVKVSKIVHLSDDLALALAAKDIRIEAPIPGKSLIGIEVPNKQVSTVSFRDVIEHEPDHQGKLLSVPLGKDISGKVIMCNLAKMPHLLIAGSTGSGKSVAINGIITSLLMQARPDQVKLMLIDPKMVELSIYNGVPHLLTPVVTESKKAASALNKVVQEMERRYKRFAASSTRNMAEYNQKVDENNADPNNAAMEKMPYIVVVVDELSDLMMVAGNEVEAAIVRLAQMARAAGIHMIVATQRPSVDVVTGLIKANIPSRIAFAVSSGIDSRTIIDQVGAEKLLGRGDMLYRPMGMNSPERIQGAYISAEDVERVVSYVQQEQPAQYDDEMLPSDNDEATGDDDNGAADEDEYYQDAVEWVAEQQKASVSMLQRRFRIGYNRAARLVDEMENRGVVGPANGSKPRQVFVHPKQNDDQNPPDDM
ncbi:ftsK protein [Lactobacillus selangorensis]|uniref:FtsK protein n=1 Tax=Lactobacillus selangorensis TaxID=81857 RepID=A0A0R2G329_9LACO|nr:DNA translocase FtsK [Lactobacillus selangorensis]KRN28458.1 ftsK protein [Lactobacillus selangorensis]KRN31959.1 ftsK protein [Lactobacillus selangorensis]